MEAFLVFFLIFVLSVTVLIVRFRRARRLIRWAKARGWDYRERDPSLNDTFGGPPFIVDVDRVSAYPRQVLSGPHRGRQVLAFEYYIGPSSSVVSDSSESEIFHVVAVSLPAQRPLLEVMAWNTGENPNLLLAPQEVRPPHPGFAEAFHVRTENGRFAHDVLNPHTAHWMLSDPRAGGLPLRFQGDMLVTWWREKLDPERTLWMADYLVDLLEKVPPFVWGAPPAAPR